MNQPSRPAPASSLWSNPTIQFIAVFVVALGLRSFFVLHYGPILTNDSDLYLTLAKGALQGKGLGLPTRVLPVYPLFLSAVMFVSASQWAIIWAQTLVGALTCVVLFATCRRLFRPRLALVLGLAVALYFPMAAFCVMVMRETLIGFLVAVTTYCLVRMLQEQTARWYWAMGVVLVATVFCQPTFLFFPVWMGLACWIHSRSILRAMRAVLPVAACLLVVVCLWTLRNYLLTSRFIPLTGDHLGCYFYLGVMNLNETREGALTADQIRHLGVAEGDPYNTYKGLVDHYVRGDLETRLRDGPVLLSRGLRLVWYQPAKYLRVTLKRLHRLWLKDLWAERMEDGYFNLRPLDQFRATHNIAALAVVGVIYAFGYSSLLGIALFWKRLLGLLVPVVTVLSFHMWMNVETRYALDIHPHLLIFSVLALLYMVRRLTVQNETRESRVKFFLQS